MKVLVVHVRQSPVQPSKRGTVPHASRRYSDREKAMAATTRAKPGQWLFQSSNHLSCSYVAHQKKASRRPSFLALRKCWAAESFNPGGRAGLQMWPSTHDGTTWEVAQQLNNACGAALKCMHKPYDIIYKLHVQRETGILPSPTQAGTPDTSHALM